MPTFKYVPKNGQQTVIEDYVVPPAGLSFAYDNYNLNRYTTTLVDRYVDNVFSLPVIRQQLTGLTDYDGELIGYIGKNNTTKYFAEYTVTADGEFNGIKAGSETLSLVTTSLAEDTNVYTLDNLGRYVGIGLAGNYIEAQSTGVTEITPAMLRPPGAVVKPTKKPGAPAAGAFWYNDFGLRYTFVTSSAYKGWYDWRWNHLNTNGFVAGVWNSGTTYAAAAFVQYNSKLWRSNSAGNVGNTPGTTGWTEWPWPKYYMDRHPLLGWYRGDDTNTLGWQVKWALEHGIDHVIPQHGGVSLIDSNWTNADSVSHWIWKLFNVVANVGGPNGMKITPWLPQFDSTSTNYFKPNNGTNWVSGTSYAVGDTVINNAFDNRLYRCKVANNSGQPNLSTTNWEVVAIPTPWTQLADILIANQTKVHLVPFDGKNYVSVYLHDMNNIRYVAGENSYKFWLKALGAYLNAAVPAWEGVAVFGRFSTPPSKVDAEDYGATTAGLLDYNDMLIGRALILRADYLGTNWTQGATNSYQSLIDRFGNAANSSGAPSTSVPRGIRRRVYTVPTALQTVPPHDSTFAYAGHSPKNFGTFVQKVYDATLELPGTVGQMLIYNMAEWAEAGPGFQPNKQDGFGYMTAFKNILCV